MMNWEFFNARQMLNLLIGANYGDNPEERLSEIIRDKEIFADIIAQQLNLTKSDNVMDFGSGPGYIARIIAGKVNTLHCFDISASFLEHAKRYCVGCDNIQYHFFDHNGLHVFESGSLDAIYVSAVFIHFDHFQIYMYLKEFSRILKEGGRILMQVFTDQDFNLDHFLHCADIYASQTDYYQNVRWNSMSILLKFSQHLNLFHTATIGDHSDILILKKGGNQ